MNNDLRNKIKALLEKGAEEAIVKENLARRLEKGEILRVKYGADPTAPDLHLGHAVALRKLREFQDLGHQIVFIIGDFTALIGDPSGRLQTRPVLSPAEIKKNAATYFKQVGKFLDVKKTEIVYNSEWYAKEGWADVLNLAAKFTIQRILERDDFSRRLKGGGEILAHEILYPMMQAYDSVKVKADVEIGGTDQKFNMLAGRDLQRKLGLKEQDILTVPLLLGTDGAKKMSKSAGNYIGVLDSPAEMFGKIMSIPDDLIPHYAELGACLGEKELAEMKKNLEEGKNPRDEKMKVAETAAALYHGEKAAEAAKNEFIKVFSKRETPSEMPSAKVKKGKYQFLDFLMALGEFSSRAEAKRLAEQKGIKIDGQARADWKGEFDFQKDAVLKIGKKKFLKIKAE